jgi:hypothetical protein
MLLGFPIYLLLFLFNLTVAGALSDLTLMLLSSLSSYFLKILIFENFEINSSREIVLLCDY